MMSREYQQQQDALKNTIEEKSAQLQEAESELFRQARLATLGQAFGGIAHEIKNPLNAIKTSAYFLLNANDLSDQKAAEHLDRIDRQVNVIDNIVTALSDVARLPKPKLRPVALNDWVRQVAADVRSRRHRRRRRSSHRDTRRPGRHQPDFHCA